MRWTTFVLEVRIFLSSSCRTKSALPVLILKLMALFVFVYKQKETKNRRPTSRINEPRPKTGHVRTVAFVTRATKSHEINILFLSPNSNKLVFSEFSSRYFIPPRNSNKYFFLLSRCFIRNFRFFSYLYRYLTIS